MDARADVFVLGCLLFLLCCRQEAFWDDREAASFRRVMVGDYTDPLRLAPELPGGVVAAIRGCLVADREERLPSAAAIRVLLEPPAPPRIAPREPPPTPLPEDPPPALPVPVTRAPPRWPGLLVAGVVGALLGAGGLAAVERWICPPAAPVPAVSPAAPAPPSQRTPVSVPSAPTRPTETPAAKETPAPPAPASPGVAAAAPAAPPVTAEETTTPAEVEGAPEDEAPAPASPGPPSGSTAARAR